jgi:nucleotide-binding universal stress UspA family protein
MTSEPMRVPGGQRSRTLDQVRAGRAHLHDYMYQLEEAVAKPAPGRGEAWAKEVHSTLVDLAAAFERHIAITEGPDGLFEDIMLTAPRLAGGVAKLAAEHKEIRLALATAIDAVRERSDAAPKDGPETEGREAVLDVINLLMRHRQLGADLIYEAYQVDVGVGD